MSDDQIILLAKTIVQETFMQLKGEQKVTNDWVTFNYARTKLLKQYKIGRKHLETAIAKGYIECNQVGRNKMISRKSLNEYIWKIVNGVS